jgi:hypothetical protein
MTTSTNMVEIEEKVVEEKVVEEKVETNNLYSNALCKLKEKVSGISIRLSTLYLLIKYVMEIIEDTPIKGAEQKELALKLMRALIIDLTEKEEEEVLLKLLNDGTVGNLIDLVVDATRGKLNINAVAKVGSGCFKVCIPYFCSWKRKKKVKKPKKKELENVELENVEIVSNSE